jgi:hypothetical protein
MGLNNWTICITNLLHGSLRCKFVSCLVRSQNRSHITTDGRLVSVPLCRARSGTCDQIFFLKVDVLFMWDALSDEKSGLSFVSISMYIQYMQGLFQSRLGTTTY